MSWIEKFPTPEGDLPPHPGPEPLAKVLAGESVTTGLRSDQKEWRERADAYNTFIAASRSYLIALAIDEFREKQQDVTVLTAAEKVAVVLGTIYLEEQAGKRGGGDIFMFLDRLRMF